MVYCNTKIIIIVCHFLSQELPPLPTGWKQTLPTADHAWVSKALFKVNINTGKPELDTARYSIIFLMIVIVKEYW